MKDIERRIEKLEQRQGVGQEEFILHFIVVRFVSPEDKSSHLEGETTICTKDCPDYESKLAEARKRAVNGFVTVCCYSECHETKNNIERG
mgnify:CR=1 FL=1